MTIQVDPRKCPQNHKCPAINVCPVKAISQEGYTLPKIDQDKCTECQKCMKYCPMRAIQKVG